MSNVIAFPLASSHNEPAESERVLSKAVVRAAEWLGVNNAVLAEIIDLPATAVNRLHDGRLHIKEDSASFQHAADFVAVFTSLHMKFAADSYIARQWMTNDNTVLYEPPVLRMQRSGGLAAVRAYVETSSIP